MGFMDSYEGWEYIGESKDGTEIYEYYDYMGHRHEVWDYKNNRKIGTNKSSQIDQTDQTEE